MDGLILGRIHHTKSPCLSPKVIGFRTGGTKLIVIPVTSIKTDSGTAIAPYEYDIEEDNGLKGRMHFDDIRCVDKMRILEYKGYINVITPRTDIEKAIQVFFDFSENTIDTAE